MFNCAEFELQPLPNFVPLERPLPRVVRGTKYLLYDLHGLNMEISSQSKQT